MGTGSGQDAAAYQVLRSPPILSDTVIGHIMEHTNLRVLASVVAGLMVSGCNVYDASLVGSATDGPYRGPPRPDIPDDGSDTGQLMFRIFDVPLSGEPAFWDGIGRNLDGYTTTVDSIAERQCDPPVGASVSVDGENGVDNTMGKELLPYIELLIPCLEDELAASHLRGEGTLLLWIQGWNGMKDDSRVTVSLLVAADGTSVAPDDVMWDMATHQLVLASDGVTPAPAPSSQQTDTYFMRPESFTGSSNPIPVLRDVAGYIADGTLVYTIPERGDIPLNAGIGSLTIRVTDGMILAELNEDFTRITSAALSGRFGLSDLLSAGLSIGICQDIRDSVERRFEPLLDVKSSASAAPGGDCEAMSLGIPFQGAVTDITLETGVPLRAGSNPPLPNACTRPDPDNNPLCPM